MYFASLLFTVLLEEAVDLGLCQIWLLTKKVNRVVASAKIVAWTIIGSGRFVIHENFASEC